MICRGRGERFPPRKLSPKSGSAWGEVRHCVVSVSRDDVRSARSVGGTMRSEASVGCGVQYDTIRWIAIVAMYCEMIATKRFVMMVLRQRKRFVI